MMFDAKFLVSHWAFIQFFFQTVQIKAIHKKGQSVSNYRPVFVLSEPSKVFEKLDYN